MQKCEKYAKWLEYAEQNLQNQIYQTKPIKLNQTYQTKPIKPNIPNQTHLTKPTKPEFLVKAVNAWVRSAFGNVLIFTSLNGYKSA